MIVDFNPREIKAINQNSGPSYKDDRTVSPGSWLQFLHQYANIRSTVVLLNSWNTRKFFNKPRQFSPVNPRSSSKSFSKIWTPLCFWKVSSILKLVQLQIKSLFPLSISWLHVSESVSTVTVFSQIAQRTREYTSELSLTWGPPTTLL